MSAGNPASATTPAPASRHARVVRIRCPVAASSLAGLLAGDTGALAQDAGLSAMLAVIRAPNPLGDFGLYTGVVEIGLGWESFTPGANATPAAGEAGVETLSPTVTLTTYIAAEAPEDDVNAALAALMAAHPWEVPVIEISEARLLLR